MSEIKKDITDKQELISSKIKPGEGGINIVEDDLYENSLEASGLELATVKKIQKHDSIFLPALELANGLSALEQFEKDEELSRVSTTVTAGSARFHASIDRSVDKPGADGETVQELGVSNSFYTAAAGKPSAKKHLKAVRDLLAAKANNSLSGDD